MSPKATRFIRPYSVCEPVEGTPDMEVSPFISETPYIREEVPSTRLISGKFLGKVRMMNIYVRFLFSSGFLLDFIFPEIKSSSIRFVMGYHPPSNPASRPHLSVNRCTCRFLEFLLRLVNK